MGNLQLKLICIAAMLLWLGSVACGYTWLLRYSLAAGQTSAAPSTIPIELGASRQSARPQLFLALHPRCPCSRATISELNRILSRAPQACDVTFLLYKPATESDRWIEGALRDECQRFPGQIRPDPDGRLAASLGSLTSGEVVLYDAEGRLCYQGGITGGRGHDGDNTGQQAVMAILQGHRAPCRSMPVFGCPLTKE